MPSYDLRCENCEHVYDVLIASYSKLKDCKCPQCDSVKKETLITRINIGGPTAAKLGRFNYRAGFNLEKAKGERRNAEAKSHMGQDPYGGKGVAIDDFHMGEGVHHPFPLKD
jgi:putative FmdB family regulatory protein